MIKESIRHLCVNKHESIGNCYWKHTLYEGRALIVVDENEHYVGVVTHKDFIDNLSKDPNDKIIDIANSNATVINDNEDEYTAARNIFCESNITNIPVISEKRDVVSYMTRSRAFYKQYFQEGDLPRMHYSVNIMAAANEAKRLGLEGISVIEFGVAGGKGLLNVEFHANEIERLTGVKIKVYGFDMGSGIPEVSSKHEAINLSFMFSSGFFVMNEKRLRERLTERTELVIGDISDTLVDFIEDKKPYPIGAILVDVDIYRSCKNILDWMGRYPDGNEFLPRVFMYFDDTFPMYERQGEEKAIREFNMVNPSNIYISPEGEAEDMGIYNVFRVNVSWKEKDIYGMRRMKICHRLNNEYYNIPINAKSAVKRIETI